MFVSSHLSTMESDTRAALTRAPRQPGAPRRWTGRGRSSRRGGGTATSTWRAPVRRSAGLWAAPRHTQPACSPSRTPGWSTRSAPRRVSASPGAPPRPGTTGLTSVGRDCMECVAPPVQGATGAAPLGTPGSRTATRVSAVSKVSWRLCLYSHCDLSIPRYSRMHGETLFRKTTWMDFLTGNSQWNQNIFN